MLACMATAASIEILCVGDIHLGREPGRVPAELLGERGLSRRDLSAATAWRRTVREARRRKVAAVLLAGDVVDSDDAYLAAYAPLAEGVRDLLDAGIAVVAVAGNHDTEVLPRLAGEIEGLRLLGAGGRWDTTLIEADGAPAVRVLGWSFPQRRVLHDPLDDLPDAFRAGDFGDGADVSTVGLVHGDLDASGGAYAPIARARLEATRSAAWLLGHVHVPHPLDAMERPIGYLGCLSGNDPGEVGARGPWIARVASGRVALERIPLAPLRFEQPEIDLTGARDANEIELRLTRALSALDERRRAEGCRADVVGVRPVLVGRSGVPPRDREEVFARAREGMRPRLEGGSYFIDRVAADRTRPDVDVEALARGTDPPAVLAQLLLRLEADDTEVGDLIERTRLRMQDESDHQNFTALGRLDVTRERAREELVRGARRALENLLDQRAARTAESDSTAEQAEALR